MFFSVSFFSLFFSFCSIFTNHFSGWVGEIMSVMVVCLLQVYMSLWFVVVFSWIGRRIFLCIACVLSFLFTQQRFLHLTWLKILCFVTVIKKIDNNGFCVRFNVANNYISRRIVEKCKEMAHKNTSGLLCLCVCKRGNEQTKEGETIEFCITCYVWFRQENSIWIENQNCALNLAVRTEYPFDARNHCVWWKMDGWEESRWIDICNMSMLSMMTSICNSVVESSLMFCM